MYIINIFIEVLYKMVKIKVLHAVFDLNFIVDEFLLIY